MPNAQHKSVKVEGLGVVAFPSSMPDHQIAAILSQHLKEHAGFPRSQGLTTEATEHARQLHTAPATKPLIPRAQQAFDRFTAPTRQGGRADIVPGAASGVFSQFVHPIATLKGMAQTINDTLPAYANVRGVPVPVPNPAVITSGQQQLQAIKEHPTYAAAAMLAPFMLPGDAGRIFKIGEKIDVLDTARNKFPRPALGKEAPETPRIRSLQKSLAQEKNSMQREALKKEIAWQRDREAQAKPTSRKIDLNKYTNKRVTPKYMPIEQFLGKADGHTIHRINQELNKTFPGGKSREYEKAPVESVPTNKMLATQDSAQSDQVQYFLDHPEGKYPGHETSFIKEGGKYYIEDGHHRVVAEILNGKKSVDGHVIDLDSAQAHRVHQD